MPGSIVTQEKLAAGEYALLQSGEFSWVSLNFLDGRLELEAAEAKPVPDIAAGTLRPAGKGCRHGGQHKPCQRDDAGGSRAGSGKRPGTHRHCPG